MIKTALSPNPRLKIILAILIFAVVFTALVVVATYYDLPISQILTKDSLEGEALGKDHGDYISYNGFGLFFEAIWLCAYVRYDRGSLCHSLLGFLEKK